LDGIGFDPYIGFYHKLEYGRPSLACDLIEEFRAPVVDRFTLSLVNNRTIGPNGFYTRPASGGMYLTRDALKLYLEKYEGFLQREFPHPKGEGKLSFRMAIREQVHKMAKAVKDGDIYEPMIFAR
jgi:CRISPR-associated protein Cas1